MQNIATLLKQRRIWSAIFGAMALLLSMVGYNGFDASVATEAVLKIVDACSMLLSIGLAAHSYFFPKK
jgi:hypothetical protein